MDSQGQGVPPVIGQMRRGPGRMRLWLVRSLIVFLAITAGFLYWHPWNDCLACAASRGSAVLVRYYLLRGSDVNERRCGYTAAMEAVWNGHLNIADVLVRHGANLDMAEDDGDTVLIWAARQGREKVVNYLIGKGASLNLRNTAGDSAIICAMRSGYPATARLLLDAGADINLENTNSETALVVAGQRGYGDMVELFKQHGAIKTNVFIGRSPYPTKLLSPARLWALATRALLIQYNGESHETLESRTESDRAWARRSLREWWGVENHQQVVKMLDWLQDSGHREGFQEKDNRPRRKGERQTRYLAWDYCRLVWVAGTSYMAGYLTEEEAWQRIMPAARTIQESYSSWREMGEDYLRGRELWHHSRDPRFDYVFQLLTNPDDPNSPWNKNKWNTDLSK